VKTIPLTKGYSALVSDEDYERVAAHKWQSLVGKNTVYAVRTVTVGFKKRRQLWLHRLILGVTDPKIDVDHEDRNGLNCQRYNLRPATRSQNMCNQRKRRGRSQYKGVTWYKAGGKWVAQIGLNGKRSHLGYFTDERQAAIAYDSAARELFGAFAHTNFPPKKPVESIQNELVERQQV
jgi:hypothetical protein